MTEVSDAHNTGGRPDVPAIIAEHHAMFADAEARLVTTEELSA